MGNYTEGKAAKQNGQPVGIRGVVQSKLFVCQANTSGHVIDVIFSRFQPCNFFLLTKQKLLFAQKLMKFR